MVGPNIGGEGRNESVELFDQGIHIPTVHQRPVFECVEFDGKTTSTTHLKAFEKPHGLWVGIDYFINDGMFCDKHIITPIIICRTTCAMLASGLS